MSLNTTKEVKIESEGEVLSFTIKKLNFGDKTDIYRAASKSKGVGGRLETDLDPFTIQEQTLLKGIVQAPFALNLKAIRELPIEVAEKLYVEIDQFCGVSRAGEEPGSGPSNEEQETQT